MTLKIHHPSKSTYIKRFLDKHGPEGLIRAANLFIEKNTLPKDVADAFHDPDVSTQDVYRELLPEIISRGWLRLTTPDNTELRTKIEESGFNLAEVRVAALSDPDDVATHAAQMTAKLIKELAGQFEQVNVGFSGGITARKMFRKLAQLLAEPSFELPPNRAIACHALVAGFDNEMPGTEPSSFFLYLEECRQECRSRFDTKFVQFHAPAFAPSSEHQTIMNLSAIAEAKAKARQLHLIVTTAAAFTDPHSQLRTYYKKHEHAKQKPNTRQDLKRLDEAECVGDIMWLPIGKQGPIALDGFDHWPVTVLDLDEIPDRIREADTKVLLVIGPCAVESHADCSKTPVLEAILDQQRGEKGIKHRYVTHLVIDKGTAEDFLRKVAEKDKSSTPKSA
jgi:DNA-binding transcriptional regulator LsrR (DeoR family)